MLKKLGMVSVLGASVVLSTAFADMGKSYNDDGRTYLGVYGGATNLTRVSKTDSIGQRNVKQTNVGYDVGAVLGYKEGSWRAEGEVGYFRNKRDKLKVAGVNAIAPEGNAETTTVMLNGYYDIDYWNKDFYPYVGAGAGYLHLKENITTNNTIAYDVTEDLFAYQAILGMQWNVTHNVGVALDYRYTRTNKGTVNVTNASGSNSSFDDNFSYHRANLVLTYLF